MKAYKILLFLIFSLGAILFFACNKEKTVKDTDETGYDKTAMLSYYADQMIIPEYKKMVQTFSALRVAADSFIMDPSSGNQLHLKELYAAAYLQYQKIAVYQFGPAEDILLDLRVNFSGGLDYSFNTAGELTGFSVDTVTIENNIKSGVYNLALVNRNSFYAQGFPALQYLFFAPQAKERLLAQREQRGKYISELITRMQTAFGRVSDQWASYRPHFVANTQTNVGSPIGNLVNQIAYQMDVLKGPRIGWPFGKQSSGIVYEQKCEAYYAGISVALAVANLETLQALYKGEGQTGLSAYLKALGKTSLDEEIQQQFEQTLNSLRLIPDPLSVSLSKESAKVDATYKEIQKLLTLLKTDLASAMAVQITFMDNDGD